jgi:hypothetical protein
MFINKFIVKSVVHEELVLDYTSSKFGAKDRVVILFGGAVPALVSKLKLTFSDASTSTVRDGLDRVRVVLAHVDLLCHQTWQRTANYPGRVSKRFFRAFRSVPGQLHLQGLISRDF